MDEKECRNKISGVYKIENIKTKKVYIGSSKDIYSRWEQHKKLLESNKHHSKKLQHSYNKTLDKTIFVLSIIELVEELNKLKQKEQFWIDEYDSFNSGYNCSMVDNPKFNKKYQSKNKKKEKVESLYKQFYSLYNPSYCNIGTTTLQRINEGHYSVRVLNQFIFGLNWFLNNFDSNNYKIYFKYNNISHKNIPQIVIYDDNEMEIDYYYIKNNELVKTIKSDNK